VAKERRSRRRKPTSDPQLWGCSKKQSFPLLAVDLIGDGAMDQVTLVSQVGSNWASAAPAIIKGNNGFSRL
jgi:hypothetical protein